MVAQTNHQTTKNAAENKWHGDLFTNGENLTAEKNSTGWFLGHQSRNSIINTTNDYK